MNYKITIFLTIEVALFMLTLPFFMDFFGDVTDTALVDVYAIIFIMYQTPIFLFAMLYNYYSNIKK